MIIYCVMVNGYNDNMVIITITNKFLFGFTNSQM